VRHMRMVRYTGVALALCLVLAWGGSPAVAADAAAEPEAKPAAAVDPAQVAAEHHAKGEVLHGKEWVPVDTLFKDYRRARAELEAAKDRSDHVKDRLATVTREMTQIKSEVKETERPVRAELGKARNALRGYNRILKKSAPIKPTLAEVPPAPKRPSGYNNSNRRNNDYDNSNSGRSSTDDRYDDRMREWQRQASFIKQANDQKSKKYQEEMAEYKQQQAEAKSEVPKLEAKIKECAAKLGEVAEDLDAKTAPTRGKSDSMTEDALAQDRRVDVIETRVLNMAGSLRASPEPLRLKHGIVEFEDIFYSAPELKATYTKTQAEIDRVRDQLKAESDKAGIPFPDAWRHPQQDRMDAMKTLVEKVQVAAGK